MNRERKEVLVNLTEKELEILDQIAKEKGLSHDTCLRQALRIFQLVETLSKKRKIDLNKLINESFGELSKKDPNIEN